MRNQDEAAVPDRSVAHGAGSDQPHLTDDQIIEYPIGLLSPEAERSVRLHLNSCETCAQEMNEQRELLEEWSRRREPRRIKDLQSRVLVDLYGLEEIGKIEPTPARRDLLSELLLGDEAYVREAAAAALGEMGARAAVPAVLDRLKALANDPSEYVRRAVRDALARLEPQAVSPASGSSRAADSPRAHDAHLIGMTIPFVGPALKPDRLAAKDDSSSRSREKTLPGLDVDISREAGHVRYRIETDANLCPPGTVVVLVSRDHNGKENKRYELTLTALPYMPGTVQGELFFRTDLVANEPNRMTIAEIRLV